VFPPTMIVAHLVLAMHLDSQLSRLPAILPHVHHSFHLSIPSVGSQSPPYLDLDFRQQSRDRRWEISKKRSSGTVT
jgi:hypothetical protein